jgi:hypothetical protein
VSMIYASFFLPFFLEESCLVGARENASLSSGVPRFATQSGQSKVHTVIFIFYLFAFNQCTCPLIWQQVRTESH